MSQRRALLLDSNTPAKLASALSLRTRLVQYSKTGVAEGMLPSVPK